MFDAISLHGYRSTAGWSVWNGLRWRLFPNPGKLVLVTESGWDRVRDGPNGTYLPAVDTDAYGPRAGSQGSLDDEAILAGFTELDAAVEQDTRAGWRIKVVAFTTSPDDTWRRKGFDLDSISPRANFRHIGPHDLMGVDPGALDWASRASVVKSCDQTAAIRRARADAIKVYRRRFGEVEQTRMLEQGDAATLVGAIIEGLAGYRDPNLYVELLNEIPRGQRALYLALCAKAVPQLRAIGLKVAGPSWATGDFERDDWDAFTGGTPTPMAAGNDGPRRRTLGAVVHSTRSGVRRSHEEEGDATLRYFVEDQEASAHKIITPTRAIVCVPKPLAAWHARNPLNATHLGYELTQTHPDVPYHPNQYKLLARELVEDARVYSFPLARVSGSNTALGIIGHEDTLNGRQDRKSDPGSLFDWALLTREIAALVRKPYNIEDERVVLWAMKDRMREHGYIRFAQAIEGITTMSKGEK